MARRLLSCATLLVLLSANSLAAGQATPPPALKRVTIGDGVTLHYNERGKGVPVIFVHGLAGDLGVWERQLEAFAGSGYRAIAYSRRYNYPNRNKLRPNHSASVEANDLAELIRQLQLPKSHIVGHSYGGYAALILSLKHPDLVRTLTLAEPPLVPWLDDLPAEYAEEGETHLMRLMTQGVKPARAAFESGDDEEGLRAIIDGVASTPTYAKLPEFVKARIRRNSKAVRAIMVSESRYPAVDRDQIRRLAVPTLILSGSDSQATARLTDLELERLIPKRFRQRVVLQRATHNMWVEQPTQCRAAVLQFLQER